jgi:hypothetical protein
LEAAHKKIRTLFLNIVSPRQETLHSHTRAPLALFRKTIDAEGNNLALPSPSDKGSSMKNRAGIFALAVTDALKNIHAARLSLFFRFLFLYFWGDTCTSGETARQVF